MRKGHFFVPSMFRQMCIRDSSEALITTAAGLAAAIPAVIAYNLIGAAIRELAARSDDFALEVLNAVEHSQAQALAQVPSEVRR